MKRYVCAILILLIAFNLFSACSKEQPSDAAAYLKKAQKYIDEGDYKSALSALTEGYELTNDSQLAAKMAEVALSISNNETLAGNGNDQNSLITIEYEQFAGIWAEDNIGWQNGGMIMDITIENDILYITLSYTQKAPSSRIAELSFNASIENIENGILAHTYESDSWGNSGSLQIDFTKSDLVQCTVSSVVHDSHSLWSLQEGLFLLKLNNSAHQAMAYTMDDYYSLHPEEMPGYYPQQPTYDTSKASGILAEAGLTEQSFREICVPLYDNQWGLYKSDYSFLTEYGRKYFQEYPEDPELLSAIASWEHMVATYPEYMYNNYGTLEKYLEVSVYPQKGKEIASANSLQTIKQMQEYPDNFIGKPYVLVNYDVQSIQNYIYSTDDFVSLYAPAQIRDLRDNVQSPTIMKNNKYLFYVIFSGTYTTYDSEIGLVFSLLSVGKIE